MLNEVRQYNCLNEVRQYNCRTATWQLSNSVCGGKGGVQLKLPEKICENLQFFTVICGKQKPQRC
jgi:hypothetical protein